MEFGVKLDLTRSERDASLHQPLKAKQGAAAQP